MLLHNNNYLQDSGVQSSKGDDESQSVVYTSTPATVAQLVGATCGLIISVLSSVHKYTCLNNKK